MLDRVVWEIKVECDWCWTIVKYSRAMVIKALFNWALGLAYVVEKAFLTMNNVNNIG